MNSLGHDFPLLEKRGTRQYPQPLPPNTPAVFANLTSVDRASWSSCCCALLETESLLHQHLSQSHDCSTIPSIGTAPPNCQSWNQCPWTWQQIWHYHTHHIQLVPSCLLKDIFPLKAVCKSRRGDCSFNCTDTSARHQGTWKIKELWHHQRNTINFQ